MKEFAWILLSMAAIVVIWLMVIVVVMQTHLATDDPEGWELDADGYPELRVSHHQPIVRLNVGCTGSMEPAIYCYDDVWASGDVTTDLVNVGTVIVWQVPEGCLHVPGTYLLHRVIWEYQINGTEYYLTQGDATNRHDGCVVRADTVMYYVVAVIKHDHERAK